MRVSSVCVTACLASIASSQGTIVSPAHFTLTEGNHSWQDPVGSGNPAVRYLQIHDDLVGNGRVINGISFRVDEREIGAVPAFGIFVFELWCSTAAAGINAANPNPTFAANHGAGYTRVVSSLLVNFPATPPTGIVLTQPFTHRIPFQIPFTYPGTGPLCWEISVTGRANPSPTGIDFDACFGNDSNPQPYTRAFGVGCRATGSPSPMTLSVTPQGVNWGGSGSNLAFAGANAPAGAFVFCNIGTSITNFGGINLPFVLPGSGAAPSGPCTLYCDSLYLVPILATAAGTYSITVGNQAWLSPGFNGRNTYYQAWGLDAQANAYGLIMSNGVRHHWVEPFGILPIARVWALQITNQGQAGPFSGTIVQFN